MRIITRHEGYKKKHIATMKEPKGSKAYLGTFKLVLNSIPILKMQFYPNCNPFNLSRKYLSYWFPRHCRPGGLFFISRLPPRILHIVFLCFPLLQLIHIRNHSLVTL